MKRIRPDDIRLWQSLINMLMSLNSNDLELVVQKIFYMEDDEFCLLSWIPYSRLIELIKNTDEDTLLWYRDDRVTK